MTWTKLSDDFSDDCWKLSDGAFRLHVEALVWSNRKLLDGEVSTDELRRFAKNSAATLIDELVAAGYWQRWPGKYVLIHHAGYQPTSEQVLARQKANQENGKKGGRPRKPRQKPSSVSESVSGRASYSVSASSDATAIPGEKDQVKTQSPTQMETQNETHRDGTGTGLYATEVFEQASNSIWCRVCGHPLANPSDAELAHRCHEMCAA